MTSTPSGRKRARIRRRWCSATASSTIRTTACSRCGTWAGTRRTPATRFRTTASPGKSPPSTSSRAPTSRSALHRDSSTVWLDLAEPDPDSALQDVALVRQLPAAVHVAGRHPLARARAARARPATARRCSTTRSARSGCSACAIRGVRGRRTASGAISKRRISSTARDGAPTSRCSGRRADLADRAAARVQRARRALQPRLRRLREPDARLFTIFRGERAGARKAERRLRRLQPRRLPLGAARPRGVPAGVGAGGRLELGQRAVGRRLLPGGRRQAVLLRQRPPRRARDRAIPASAAPAWPRCAATVSRRWIIRPPAAASSA